MAHPPASYLLLPPCYSPLATCPLRRPLAASRCYSSRATPHISSRATPRLSISPPTSGPRHTSPPTPISHPHLAGGQLGDQRPNPNPDPDPNPHPGGQLGDRLHHRQGQRAALPDRVRQVLYSLIDPPLLPPTPAPAPSPIPLPPALAPAAGPDTLTALTNLTSLPRPPYPGTSRPSTRAARSSRRSSEASRTPTSTTSRSSAHHPPSHPPTHPPPRRLAPQPEL